MKTETIALAIAGAATLLIIKALGKGTTTASGIKRCTANGATPSAALGAEMFDADGQPFSNGWRYFANGYAISPECIMFKAGQGETPTAQKKSADFGMFSGMAEGPLLLSV